MIWAVGIEEWVMRLIMGWCWWRLFELGFEGLNVDRSFRW